MALGALVLCLGLALVTHVAEPGPLFAPDESAFGRFIDNEPPPMRWVLDGFLPAEVVGLIAATGGVGKSYLAYSLGFSVATGCPFAGFDVGEEGSFLYLAAEDDEGELHRRGHRILEHYRQVKGWSHMADAMVAERLHVISRVGENNLLTAKGGDGEVYLTPLVDRIVETANQLPQLRVIVIDPVTRFRGGKASDEDDTTRFVQALEVICKATGATVLATAHVTKASIRDGGGQEAVRNSSALVDGVRWVAKIQGLREDEAHSWGVDKADAREYFRLEVPKSNYTAAFDGMWLRRDRNGLLVPAELERREAKRDTEQRYQEILTALQDLIRREGGLTANAIEKDYAGRTGVLGAGRNDVRGVIQSALKRGDLEQERNLGRGGGRVLVLPGGAS